MIRRCYVDLGYGSAVGVVMQLTFGKGVVTGTVCCWRHDCDFLLAWLVLINHLKRLWFADRLRERRLAKFSKQSKRSWVFDSSFFFFLPPETRL